MFLSLRKFVMLGKVSKVIIFERFGLMQRAGIRQIVQRDSNEKRALVFVSPRSLSIFFADLLTFLAVDVNFLPQENEKKKKKNLQQHEGILMGRHRKLDVVVRQKKFTLGLRCGEIVKKKILNI